MQEIRGTDDQVIVIRLSVNQEVLLFYILPLIAHNKVCLIETNLNASEAGLQYYPGP
jgi:hypothetical protein